MKKFKFRYYNSSLVPKDKIYSFYCVAQEESVDFLEKDYNYIRAYLIESLYLKNTSNLFCKLSFNKAEKPNGFFKLEEHYRNQLFIKDSPQNVVRFFLEYDRIIGDTVIFDLNENIYNLKDFISLEKEYFTIRRRLMRFLKLSEKRTAYWEKFSNSCLSFYLMSGGFDYFSQNDNTSIKKIVS